MKDKIIELLDKNAKEGWNGDVEAVGYTDFESVAEQLVKLFSIHDAVVSEERTELPLDDIKGFAKYVLGLSNRLAKKKMIMMTEAEGDILIDDLWLNYKFNTPVPQR